MSSHDAPEEVGRAEEAPQGSSDPRGEGKETWGLKHAVMLVAALNLGFLAAAIYLQSAPPPALANPPAVVE